MRNKKFGKTVAALVLGIVLLGNSIPVQAAASNCYEHHGIEIGNGSHGNSYVHTHGVYQCKVVQYYEDYKVVCQNCGAVLSTRSVRLSETHTSMIP